MTKKNYESIASVFTTVFNAPDLSDREKVIVATLAGNLAHTFKATNERFDRARFLSACQRNTAKVEN